MASSNRSTKISRIQKTLKKAGYSSVAADSQRTVLEQLLFAACLEDARYDDAEQAFAALERNFFDWNEVRVTTVRELSEEMACLPDSSGAANRVRQILQSVFEARYAFDLEDLRKENLGPATEQLRKMNGASPFVVSYVIQASLGGHSIPIDAAAMRVMQVLDLVKDEEAAGGAVPGLERAVPKNKGVEFGSQLHQFAVDFAATPHKPELRKILLDIDPDAAPRLPKRRSKQAKAEAEEEPAKPAKKGGKKASGTKADESKKSAGKPKKTAKPAAKKSAPKSKPAKKTGGQKKTTKSKAGSKDSSQKRTASNKGLSKKKPR